MSAGPRNKATSLYKSNGTVGGLSQNYINSLGNNIKRKLKIFQKILDVLKEHGLRGPPNWKLLITDDDKLLSNNVAVLNLQTKAFYVHLYFFALNHEELSLQEKYL